MDFIDGNLNYVFDEALSHYSLESEINVEKYDREFEYESMDFVVHPGWTAKNYELDWEEQDRKEPFIQKFYQDYMNSLGEVFQQSSSERPVFLVYSEGGRSHAETIIDQFGGAEIAGSIQTLEHSGQVPESSFEEVEEEILKTDPDGEIKVHGEIDGRCRSVFQEQLEDNTMPDLEVEKGVSFPPEPTWNYVFTTNVWHR